MPAALVGETVMVLPETVTFRKLYTSAADCGGVVPVPQLEPEPLMGPAPLGLHPKA